MENIKITHGQYKRCCEHLANIEDFISTQKRKGSLQYVEISDEKALMELSCELESVKDLCISIMDLSETWFDNDANDEQTNEKEFIKYGYGNGEYFASVYDTHLLNESQLEPLLALISQLKGEMMYIYYKFNNQCYNKENFTVAQYQETTEEMAELADEVHAICEILAKAG